MRELSREQEQRIAALALIHGRVADIRSREDGTVELTVEQRQFVLDINGNMDSVAPERAYMPIPIKTLRRMLGDARVNEALESVAERQYPDHALATVLGDEVRAMLDDLLHAREAAKS